MNECRPDYKEWEYKVRKALRSLFWEWRGTDLRHYDQAAKDTMMVDFLNVMLHRLILLRDTGGIRQTDKRLNINKTVNQVG